MDLKNIEWQEFFTACWIVAGRYFKMGDYENALISYQEYVDVIERFMYPDKQGCDAYPIYGTHSNHAIAQLDIAACLFRLGRTDGIDALIEKAKHIYFDTFEHMIEEMGISYYTKEMRKMIDYFTTEYNKRNLCEYKPLDLSEIEKRISERET